MSASELERFSADLKSDVALREKLAENGTDLGAIVEAAQARGYDLTVADVQARITDEGGELSEEELDGVAGGRRSSFSVLIQSGGNSVFVHW